VKEDYTFTFLKPNTHVVSTYQMQPTIITTLILVLQVFQKLSILTLAKVQNTNPLNANVQQDTHGRAAARTTDVNTPTEQLPVTTRSGRVVRPPQAYRP
jgi:hypothetical protein